MAQVNVQAFSGDVEISSDLTVDGDTLVVNATSDRVGINKAVPAYTLDVDGDINFTGTLRDGGNPFGGSPWTVSGDNLTYTTGNVAVGTSQSAISTSFAKHTVQGISRITDGTNHINMRTEAGSGVFTAGADLVASDTAADDGAGIGLGMSGDGKYVAMGAYNENNREGAVYMWHQNVAGAWSQQQKLTENPRQTSRTFGMRVALDADGDTLAVNSVDHVEIWVRSGSSWSRQAELPHTMSYGFLDGGIAISQDGNTVVYGASREEANSLARTGKARIATRTNASWTVRQVIQEGTPKINNYFGKSCAISDDGNTVLIMNNAQNGDMSKGYIYRRNTPDDLTSAWTLQATLTGSNWNQAGYDGRISGDASTVAVGATFDLSGKGSVDVWVRSGTGYSSWAKEATILDPNNSSSPEYAGFALDLTSDGNILVVGSPGDAQGGTNTGSINSYKRVGTSWSHLQQFRGNNPLANKQFGASVRLANDAAIMAVGVPDAVIFSPTGASTGGRIEVTVAQIKLLLVDGSITAAGTQLTFTGQHLCFPEGPIERGLVVSANRNKFMNLNGPLTTGLAAIKSSESLPIVSLSNVVNDSTVFGVVDSVETLQRERSHSYGKCLVTSDKEWGDNRAIINSLGEGAIWVVNTNGNISSGEYITTSNIIGYGHKQDDDILHSYTVAKITMDCNFNPEDIPIQVIKKDENGNNIIDQYDRLQWEDTDETQKMYDIKYLTVDGGLTDQANSVWTAAYVGCTYHCG